MPADERPALTQVAPPASPTPPATATATAIAPPTQTAAAGPDCGALDELHLLLVGGRAGCDEVRRVAAGYDLTGAKVQEVAGWTCATGTVQTRPVVFTCTRGAAEFVARESG